MAALLRLAILCACVATIMAASTKQVADDPQPTEAPATTPAPAPECTEGERQADKTDCHKFTECKNGAWKDDKCFWFRKFDSEAKRCVMWGAKCAQ